MITKGGNGWLKEGGGTNTVFSFLFMLDKEKSMQVFLKCAQHNKKNLSLSLKKRGSKFYSTMRKLTMVVCFFGLEQILMQGTSASRLWVRKKIP